MDKLPARTLDFTADGSILVFDKLCKNYQFGAVELKVLREIDLVVKKGEEEIAVEIETGKSDCNANVQACLEAGFKKIVVVATSRTAFIALLRIQKDNEWPGHVQVCYLEPDERVIDP